jgi:hypothetical protein
MIYTTSAHFSHYAPIVTLQRLLEGCDEKLAGGGESKDEF